MPSTTRTLTLTCALALLGCSPGVTVPDAGSPPPDAGRGPGEKVALVHISQSPPVFGRIGFYEVWRGTSPVGECTETPGSLGPCRHVHCPKSAAQVSGVLEVWPRPGIDDFRAVSAGVVTLSGGSGGPVTLVPDGGTYADITAATQLWSPGTMLTLSAVGDEVPPFQVSLTAPGPMHLEQPACDSQLRCGGVSRATPLTARWDGGVAGTIAAIGVTSTVDFVTDVLRCETSAPSRMLTVPTDALAKLALNDAGTLALGPASRAEVTAGQWRVVFEVVEASNEGGWIGITP